MFRRDLFKGAFGILGVVPLWFEKKVDESLESLDKLSILESKPKPKFKSGNYLDNLKGKTPIKHMIWDPQTKGLKEEAVRRGLKFTLGKKYPVLSEISCSSFFWGVLCVVEDDNGDICSVNSHHFIDEQKNLMWTGEMTDEWSDVRMYRRRDKKYDECIEEVRNHKRRTEEQERKKDMGILKDFKGEQYV